jgi:hypothetical protein
MVCPNISLKEGIKNILILDYKNVKIDYLKGVFHFEESGLNLVLGPRNHSISYNRYQ